MQISDVDQNWFYAVTGLILVGGMHFFDWWKNKKKGKKELKKWEGLKKEGARDETI